jgi:hypothetical protein
MDQGAFFMSCAVGTVSGEWIERKTGVEGRSVFNIHCGKWICEDCRKRKAKKVMARALKGGLVEKCRENGYREEYNYKLLTLTCPGHEYRMKTSKDDAYKDLQEGYTKLVKALRHRGWFEYLRVVEPQQDGFPHFHVLLVGHGIRRKEILQEIVKLWSGIYGLGFIKLNALKRGEGHGIENAIKYVLKYLFKGPYQGEKVRMRVYATSKGAMAKWEKMSLWFNATFRANTSVEFVVRNILGMEVDNGHVTGNEEGEIESWEVRYIPIAGVPF